MECHHIKIDKLYYRYEAMLGADMTKTLGNLFIYLDVMGGSKYFNVISPTKVLKDLEEEPLINHAVTSVCFELYYKYGIYLALFTALLTAVKHINFYKNKNSIDKNGEPGNSGSSRNSENSNSGDK